MKWSFGGEFLSEREKRNISILETLRRAGPLSKPDISQRIGLNVVTVSNYVDDFLKNRMVFEKELDVSEGGRRPVLLDLNPDSAYSIGIGVNLFESVGLVLDLKGNVLAKVVNERLPKDVYEVGEHVKSLVKIVLDKSKDKAGRIKGIGIGISGLVNKNDGSISWPQKVSGGYTYVPLNSPLRSSIEKEFGLPVTIENDATCACFGEQWTRKDLERGNVVFIFSGVGCGIMIDWNIYTGSSGFAGEISIDNPSSREKMACGAGDDCILQRCEADVGIIENARKILDGRKSVMLELCAGDVTKLTLKNVFLAAKNKDAAAAEILQAGAKRLGLKIAFLVNLLNPEMVIIGGGFETAGEAFLAQVRLTVSEWSFKEMSSGLKIVYSDLSENSVAMGAASLVVRKIFAQ